MSEESSELTYLPICGPCIRGEGSECHTPGCALWLRDVSQDGLISEFALDLSAVRREGAVVELLVAARLFEYEMADAWGRDARWISTGSHVADLVAAILREQAAALRDDA